MTPATSDAAAPAAPAARARRRFDPRYYRGFLSAIFPGLGQVAARHYRVALLLGGPVLLAMLGLAALALLGDRIALATRLADPDVLLVLLGFQAIVLVLRLVASLMALEPRRLRRTRAVVATALLVTFVVVPQLYFGYVTLTAHDEFGRIFAPSHGNTVWVPVANETAPPPDPSDDPFVVPATVAPSVMPAPDSRVTVLLIGVDSGINRSTANTDTMIIASLDPTAETVSLLSIPRDTVDVPLPDGRVWGRKINSLMAYARWHPGQFPGAPSPQSVLAAGLSSLTGVQIDYWAQVDLYGLVKVVNAVGGIDVNITRGFCDPYYQEYGQMGFAVLPGRYHMNGSQALAYARVRHPSGESDFTRATRQQEVVVALRDRLVSGGFLNDPIGLLHSLGDTISTSIPPAVISEYAALGREVTRSHIYNEVVDAPLVRSDYDSRGSIQKPDVPGIRDLASRLFSPAGQVPVGFTPMSDVPDGRAGNLPKLDCYAPKPPAVTPAPSGSATPTPDPGWSDEPTPTPTPRPSSSPTPSRSPSPSPTKTPSPSPTPVPTPTEKPTPASSASK